MKKIRNDIKQYKYTKGFTLIEIIFGIAITATAATAIYLVGNHVNQTNKNDNEIKFLTQTLNDIDLMTTVSNSYQGFNKEQLSSVRKNTNSAFGVNDITMLTPQQISINYNNIPSGNCLSIVNSMVKLTDTSAKVNGVTIPNNSNNNIINPACAANNLNTISIIRNKSMVGATAAIAADAPALTPTPSISTPAVVSPSSNTPTSFNNPVGTNVPIQVAVLNPSNNNPNQTTLTPIPTSLPVVPVPVPSPAPVTPVPSPTPIPVPVTPPAPVTCPPTSKTDRYCIKRQGSLTWGYYESSAKPSPTTGLCFKTEKMEGAALYQQYCPQPWGAPTDANGTLCGTKGSFC